MVLGMIISVATIMVVGWLIGREMADNTKSAPVYIEVKDEPQRRIR